MHMPVARPNNGGGAIAMWRLARALQARGLDVRVSADRGALRSFHGFKIGMLRTELRAADVLLTPAGDRARRARREAAARRIPVVCFVHSGGTPAWAAAGDRPALVVYASAAMETRIRERGIAPEVPSMVMWPLLDADAVRADARGEYVTLVNLMPEKGAHLFWEIARRMPHVHFLGVRGGWNAAKQVVPRDLPSNAHVAPFETDVRKIYRRTGVLLYMRGEDAGPNWLTGVGLAAMEAAVNGIPTIAHPGPGLVESMGDGATWVDSDDPADWCAAIDRVRADYAARSRAARERVAALTPDADLTRLIESMAQLTSRMKCVPA
jgi:glycosyltransferase involved in cell wall biosynthesis